MTSSSKLQGVIAAIATAVDATGEPDCARSVALARFLLARGCDGLNVLGTTGEATSFSLEQRKRVMTAYRDAGLPLDRLMVGTGAASVADAIALTRHAAELGFAGALVLPPFYYKGVPVRPAVARPTGQAPHRRVRHAHRRPEGFLGRHGLCARSGGALPAL
jgi:4-hydroxy-tetrahydrodipicolinate synthase